ncbi:MAG: 50S ribosomal protein L10, partial [Verrucomicrobiota bacterium]
MRPEKQYLVEEVSTHLDKSNYVYLTNYERITVDEIAELRASLSEHNAEFHVVKN